MCETIHFRVAQDEIEQGGRLILRDAIGLRLARIDELHYTQAARSTEEFRMA